jgi:beta-lactamase regulating signal transducer with metallopeptidase domain
MMLSLYPDDRFALSCLRLMLLVTALSVVALLVARTVARRDPSMRYVVGLCAICGSLLGPSILLVTSHLPFPAISISLPPTPGGHAAAHATDFPRTMFAVLSFVWLAGVLFGLARLVKGCREVSHLRRSAQPIEEGLLASALPTLRELFGERLPLIAASAEVGIPGVVGLFRPLVLLPEGMAQGLTPSELSAVLAHECAHIAHRHPLVRVLQRLAAVVFWPHPCIHFLNRSISRASEEVCDNYALRVTGAACFARTLLAMAERRSHAPLCSPALALLGPGWRLEERIAGLLNPRRNRMTRTKRWKVCVAVAALAITSGLAGVRVMASSSGPDEEPHLSLILDVQAGPSYNPETSTAEVTFSNEPTDSHLDVTLRPVSGEVASTTAETIDRPAK